MIVNIAVLFFALAGFVLLALAMDKHAKQLMQRSLAPRWRQLARSAGWLLLAAALALGIYALPYDIGIVAWLGWLSVAGIALVFALPRIAKPEPPKKQRKSRDKSPDEPIAAPAPALGNGARIAIGGILLATPLMLFAWQLGNVPPKPTLRDDALSGTVGPWSFVIAEKDLKAPVIEALDVPMKQFVLRFCSECDGNIKNAYLKVRKPRSARAAGNGFFGEHGEREAEIAIPAAAKLDDGIWLTVEGNDGTRYETRFDIERLSPATAHFIRKRS